MRNVPPHLTGAASGVNNALRQTGSVLAGAVVGAVLQGRLAAGLKEQAARHAGEVPAGYRTAFVHGFDAAGRRLDVASGTAAPKLPEDVPAGTAARVREAAGAVFGHGFVDAMGPTLLLCAGVLAVGALSCLFVRPHAGASGNPHGLPMTEEEIAAAAG
jgi:hypothetical protein